MQKQNINKTDIYFLALGLSLADGFLFTICSSLLPWLLATVKILSQIVNRSCDNPTHGGVGLPQDKLLIKIYFIFKEDIIIMNTKNRFKTIFNDTS